MSDPAGITDLFGQLVVEAREVATAEVALVKARALEATARYRTAAIFFLVAGTLSLAALIALLVGLILTLAPLVGPGLATAIVVGTVIVIAAILGLLGKARLSPATRAASPLPEVRR